MSNIKIQLKADELKKRLNIKDGERGEIGPAGPKGDKGEAGVSPDIEQIVVKSTERVAIQIKPIIPTIDQLEKNIPILGEPIRDSLELLQGDERLDKSAIKGLKELEELAGESKKIVGGGSIARNFYQLFDAPQSYAGQAGNAVVVKSDETGLELVNKITGVGIHQVTVAHDAPSSPQVGDLWIQWPV
jgi:hypothetical protein